MRRTQLYIEEGTWKLLHVAAKEEGTTISEMVRRAIEEKYAGAVNRKAVLRQAVGLWANRQDLPDTERSVRSLRKGSRLDRFAK